MSRNTIQRIERPTVMDSCTITWTTDKPDTVYTNPQSTEVAGEILAITVDDSTVVHIPTHNVQCITYIFKEQSVFEVVPNVPDALLKN